MLYITNIVTKPVVPVTVAYFLVSERIYIQKSPGCAGLMMFAFTAVPSLAKKSDSFIKPTFRK